MRPEDPIPRPRRVSGRPGSLDLRRGIRLASGPGAEVAAAWLGTRLGPIGGGAVPVALAVSPAGGGAEDYRLAVSPEAIRLEGSATGLFRGAASLGQLLSDERGAPAAEVPCCEIEDSPAFAWRGLLLDCSRHLLGTGYLRHAVETMAELKLNRLHLHLVDDQGWRMEIASRPKLTAVGAFVEPGPRCQGFYTKAELRELVEFAAARGIEVVPEIEVPGHSYAAVRSYPELCCTGRPERTSDLEKVYSARYAPADLSPEERERVFGAECCVWTEHLVEEELDAMLFPRVLACAELMWSDPPERDFADFRRRVRLAEGRWRALGIEYGPETGPRMGPGRSPGVGGA